MNKEFTIKEIQRLNKYLEHVQNQLSSTTGELNLFWKREEGRTKSKMAKLV